MSSHDKLDYLEEQVDKLKQMIIEINKQLVNISNEIKDIKKTDTTQIDNNFSSVGFLH